MSGAGFESVAVKFVTEEGFAMAVGGICLPGTAAYWSKRFQLLKSLRVSGGNLYTIDCTMAQAIQNIADESLLIAGCSLDAKIKLKKDESTGGVLGCPQEPIDSAINDCERLSKGFSLYTASGGPGIAALADSVTTKRVAMDIKALGDAPTKEEILQCIHKAGMETFLLVFDGSGPNAVGCVVSGSPGKSTVVFLKE